MGGAGYFIFKDYDGKIAELQTQVDNLKGLTNTLRTLEMTAKLGFPTAADASSIQEVSIIIQRENHFDRIKVKAEEGFDRTEKIVQISNLHAGDYVQVRANTANPPSKTYQSKQFQITTSEIVMADTQ